MGGAGAAADAPGVVTAGKSALTAVVAASPSDGTSSWRCTAVAAGSASRAPGRPWPAAPGIALDVAGRLVAVWTIARWMLKPASCACDAGDWFSSVDAPDGLIAFFFPAAGLPLQDQLHATARLLLRQARLLLTLPLVAPSDPLKQAIPNRFPLANVIAPLQKWSALVPAPGSAAAPHTLLPVQPTIDPEQPQS